jgi:four helix bundle protein
VDEMQPDEQLGLPVRQPPDRMGVPHLLEQSRWHRRLMVLHRGSGLGARDSGFGIRDSGFGVRGSGFGIGYCWLAATDRFSRDLHSQVFEICVVQRDPGCRKRDVMATIQSFRDLLVWNAAMDLVLTTYAVVTRLPAAERFVLGTQLRRAAVSIPSNIAEGHASGPGRRYLNHVRIAVASLAELDTQFEIARRLRFLSTEDVGVAEQQLTRTGQLLHGLLRSLRKRQTSASREPRIPNPESRVPSPPAFAASGSGAASP